MATAPRFTLTYSRGWQTATQRLLIFSTWLLMSCIVISKSKSCHCECQGGVTLVGGALQIKSASLGGLEPPTFWLTAEHTNRFHHGGKTQWWLVC